MEFDMDGERFQINNMDDDEEIDSESEEVLGPQKRSTEADDDEEIDQDDEGGSGEEQESETSAGFEDDEDDDINQLIADEEDDLDDEEEKEEIDEDEEKYNQMLSAVMIKNKKPKRRNQSINLNEQIEFGDAYDAPTVTLDSLMNTMNKTPGFAKVSTQLSTIRVGERTAPLKPLLPEQEQNELTREIMYRDTTLAANEKWGETIILNRQKRHVSYPLPESDEAATASVSIASLQNLFKPQSELETSIAEAVLRASGVPKQEIDAFNIEKSDSYDAKQEIKKRNDELRRLRNLAFYNDIKNKRKAKIKSKTFRALERKSQSKKLQQQSALLEQADPEAFAKQQEEEAARAAYLQLKERVTQKHSNKGKWAKNLLSLSHKSVDQRRAISETNRMRRDLLQKQNYRDINNDDDLNPEALSDRENEEDEAVAAEITEEDRKQIEKGVFGMNFMKREREEEQRRYEQELKEEKEQERREKVRRKQEEERGENGANGDSSQPRIKKKGEVKSSGVLDVDNDSTVFEVSRVKPEAPTPIHQTLEKQDNGASQKNKKQKSKTKAKPIEEAEQEQEVESNPWLEGSQVKVSNAKKSKNRAIVIEERQNKKQIAQSDKVMMLVDVNSVLEKTAPPTSNTSSKSSNSKSSTNALTKPPTQPAVTAVKPSNMINTINKTQNVTKTQQSQQKQTQKTGGEDEDNFTLLNAKDDQRALIERAFEEDDVMEEFQKEKEELENEEDEHFNGPFDKDLAPVSKPGWGSWTGSGVTTHPEWTKKIEQRKKEQEEARIKRIQNNRKDRMDRGSSEIYVRQKVPGAHRKYVAKKVPYPFDNRQQYEMSLVQPLGKDWNTYGQYKKAIEPAMKTKAGVAIKPLAKPIKRKREEGEDLGVLVKEGEKGEKGGKGGGGRGKKGGGKRQRT
eukprot:TRINITY_DN2387_c0_g1_i2.p1 TRINITY_DN2387_c0_g1~~TRINITY_DN2387_c0_g1_i2.p1  ORF type:complete len:1021 (-),score=423.09 TRINITY_DN2387_c0_g1_i2:44-2767(-)